MLDVHNIHFGYTADEEIITKFSLKIHKKDRIGVIGRNGKGKSTLLRLLIGESPYSSGKIKQHVDLKIGYFSTANIEQLDPEKTILEELMQLPDVSEQQVRTVCGALLFSGITVKKHIRHLSGGEKSRVCFAKVLLSSAHLLVLDEPTNHLDMESCQALIAALDEFEGTVLFVTHDEKMLSNLANRLVVFDKEGITVKEKTYSEFLEDDGWADEEADGINFKKYKSPSDNKVQYLETKEQRKALRKVQSDQKKLLQKIETLENQQKENGLLLQKAYEDTNRDVMEKLGRESKNITDKITSHYTELESMMAMEMEIETQLSQN